MHHILRAVGLLSILLLSSSVLAQNTDIEALAGLQFNFGNPGARALGMGGAFLALADDASAAEANPAGLTILRRPEVSVEARRTAIGQTFATGGSYPFLSTKTFSARSTEIAFASVVVPWKNFAFAAYVHRPLDFGNEANLLDQYTTPTFHLEDGGLVDRVACERSPRCATYQIYPYKTRADLQLTTIGGAGAWKIGRLSLGAALRYQRFSEEAKTTRVDLDVAGQPSFVVIQENGSRLFGRDHDEEWSVATGMKWQVRENFSVGAVWHQGASFPAPIAAAQANAAPEIVRVVDFRVPGSVGVGLSWRPAAALTLNADAIRISYSDLVGDFASVIEYGTEAPGEIEALHGYGVDDGTEWHAGIEYYIPVKASVALRAGWWRDPAHSIEWRGPVATRHEAAAMILFPESAADDHYTVGIGVSWPLFQIDAAWDHGQRLQTGSISFVARF